MTGASLFSLLAAFAVVTRGYKLHNEADSAAKPAGSLKVSSQAQAQLKLHEEVHEGHEEPPSSPYYLSFKRMLRGLEDELHKIQGPSKESKVAATPTASPPPSLSSKPAAVSIPKKLLFNHKFNLLKKTDADLANDEQSRLLRQNVLHTISLFPEVAEKDVHFWDDADCQRNIEDLSMEDGTLAEALALDFASEKVGMIKSDLCRLVMIYMLGGAYFDSDILVTSELKAQLLPEATFATVVAEGGVNFFQAFLAATPNHPVIEGSLKEFKVWYDQLHRVGQNQEQFRSQTAGGNIGTALLRKAYDNWAHGAGKPLEGLIKHGAGHISQFFTEQKISSMKGYHGTPNVLPGHSGGLCDYAVAYKPTATVAMYSRIYDSHTSWHRVPCSEEIHLLGMNS